MADNAPPHPFAHSTTLTTISTRVAKGSKSEIDALAPTTVYTAWSNVPSSTSRIPQNSTITETLIHTVTTIIRPSVTSASANALTSNSTFATNSPDGYIAAHPRHFPTALVAILLSLFSLFLLVAIVIYLRHRGTFASHDNDDNAKSSDYVWGTFGLVRRRSAHKSKSMQNTQQMREDPIAAAIRREEQERLRRQKRNGMASFYAPQVQHLVESMGGKEELRVDVGNRWGPPRRQGSKRWGAIARRERYGRETATTSS